MIDGLDARYLDRGDMPRLAALGAQGTRQDVAAVLPTVTNANNVSIACAALPDEHGITGNSYLDEATGSAQYMEDGSAILTPTLFQRARATGMHSALLTAKVKTITLLAAGASVAVAAERPEPELVDRHGPAPDIYSAEINFWLFRVAIDLLERRPDLDLVYVHTTDFPMHAWRPHDERSIAHLHQLDELIAAAASIDDVALYATADHGMNDKTRCWDLAKACANRGAPVRFALSAERDRYVRHHRTFGGTAWVWLHDPTDVDAVANTISGLPGVEHVLGRDEAARRYRLLPERIGDLVVLGDHTTVFGELDGEEMEPLEDGYRSHGSLHERTVPLITYNTALPEPDSREYNAELLAPLRAAFEDGRLPARMGRDNVVI
jgi:phosphonoacetate hydrolase